MIVKCPKCMEIGNEIPIEMIPQLIPSGKDYSKTIEVLRGVCDDCGQGYYKRRPEDIELK